MPSEFNHIDEFFRKKENETAAPDHLQDQHWEKMKEALSSVPGSNFLQNKTWPSKTIGITSLILATAAVVFILVNKNGSEESIQKKNSTTASTYSQPIPNTNDSFPGTKRIILKQDTIHVKTTKIQIIKKALKLVEDSIQLPVQKVDLITREDITQVDPKKAFENFFSELKKPSQVFVIQSSADTTIYGKEGTVLFIPANSFESSTGTVTISLKEFYSIGDIIGNKLSTMSGDKPLETGGMLHVEAFSEGKPVLLKKDASLGLNMPASAFDPRMQLFIGSTNNTLQPNTTMDTLLAGSDGSVNWIPSGQQQSFFATNRKFIRIWNLRNNPVEVKYKHEFNPSKMKTVGEFRIPWNSAFTIEEIKTELVKRFGRYYDIIKVKKERKPWFAKNRLLDSSFTKEWYDSPYVGDTVTMHISTATRLNYISREDSLRYEAAWKEQLELAIKRNASYNQFLQMNTQYNFKISALGWINCDRFLAYPSATLTNFAVATSTDFNETYFYSVLLFKKENVLLKGYSGNQKINFGRIPKGTEVSVICVGVKDGKTYGCVQDLIVKDEPVQLQFEETTPVEMKVKLKRFGTVSQRG